MSPDFLRALDLAKGLLPTPKNLEKVAAQTTVAASRWAFGQWELRDRARTKFENAEAMLFDREGLEMATHQRISAWRASRFPRDEVVLDICCGLGGDLIALGHRSSSTSPSAVGYEMDAARAELAVHNVRVCEADAEVRVGDGLSATRAFKYGFADPSRRRSERRTTDPEEFTPPLSRVIGAFRSLKLGAIKLSPMLPDATLDSMECLVEFVSFGGECREALVWLGEGVETGRRCCHVESGELLFPDDPLPITAELGEYLFDADPAAVRGGALGTLCSSLRLEGVGDSNGYLTGDHLVHSSWLRAYRVLYWGAADLKHTNQALRACEGYVFEVKQRQAGLDVERLRRELIKAGSNPVSLAAWNLGKRTWHALLQLV